jgi:sarcosine oxidase
MAGNDVIVVGLGAMGSSALYHLSRRGLRVLGLEAFEPNHRLGSFHGESRVIRLAYYEHPSYVPLLRRAYVLWDELQRESGEDLLRIIGGVMIGRPESELVSGARSSAEQHGLEYELIGSAEVPKRFPALHAAEDEVALWEPNAGFLRPERCVEAHARLARAAGATTRYSEPVRSWRADSNGVEVTTEVGVYTAEHVVFTAGARISKILGASMPTVAAERATLFWMEPSDADLFALGRCPIYMWDPADGDMFYGFPHVEWPGVKVARHHTGDFCDPDEVDRSITADDELRLRHAIEKRMPALNGRVLSGLVCLYEDSPDYHFVIDRVADHPRVVYAGGFSGHGFKFASVVGEVLADLVTTGQTTPDADFLRAGRFAV